jgi:hypothetical protein
MALVTTSGQRACYTMNLSGWGWRPVPWYSLQGWGANVDERMENRAGIVSSSHPKVGAQTPIMYLLSGTFLARTYRAAGRAAMSRDIEALAI